MMVPVRICITFSIIFSNIHWAYVLILIFGAPRAGIATETTKNHIFHDRDCNASEFISHTYLRL
jgi:hypothetical protein